jgi:hypothetical protein
MRVFSKRVQAQDKTETINIKREKLLPLKPCGLLFILLFSICNPACRQKCEYLEFIPHNIK